MEQLTDEELKEWAQAYIKCYETDIRRTEKKIPDIPEKLHSDIMVMHVYKKCAGCDRKWTHQQRRKIRLPKSKTSHAICEGVGCCRDGYLVLTGYGSCMGFVLSTCDRILQR